jgi:predicted MarR family transcription regulator
MSKRADLISYVAKSLHKLNKADLVEVLRIIMKNVENNKITEKGDGTQIMYDDINTKTLKLIKEYISQAIEQKEKAMHEMMAEVENE